MSTSERKPGSRVEGAGSDGEPSLIDWLESQGISGDVNDGNSESVPVATAAVSTTPAVGEGDTVSGSHAFPETEGAGHRQEIPDTTTAVTAASTNSDTDTDSDGGSDGETDGAPTPAPQSWGELLGSHPAPGEPASSPAIPAGVFSRRNRRRDRTRGSAAGACDNPTPTTRSARVRRQAPVTSTEAGTTFTPGHRAGLVESPGQQRPRRGIPRPPRWVILTATGVTGVAVLIAAWVGGTSLMGDQTPVAASNPDQPSLSPITPSASAVDVPAGQPAATVPVFAGHCSDDQITAGAQRLSGSQDDLRATVVAFQQAYFAHDADTLRSLIDDSSKDSKAWKDQDWAQVFNALPANETFCVTMPALSTSADASVTSQLSVSEPIGDQREFTSKVIGTKKDGKWVIKRMDAIDTPTRS